MKLPPYVQCFRDRTGKPRLYFRKAGLPRVALPNPATDKQGFLRAYQTALSGTLTIQKDIKGGTLEALIVEYMRSSDFKALKPNSRAAYTHAFNFLRRREGAKAAVAAIRASHIERLRDEIAETKPGKANLVIKALKVLMTFAVRRDYRDTNPATEISMVRMGEHRSWTDEELAQFEARWPRGTTERLIYELALYTGQRRGDIAKMTWADIKDGGINVVQQKTGAKLWIPLHQSLSAELATTERRHSVLLASPSGKSYTPSYLGATFSEAISAANLPPKCVLHGLRKAATRRLAEAGATDAEIMAVTGHRSRHEVTRYTRQADQGRLATQAMERLANTASVKQGK